MLKEVETVSFENLCSFESLFDAWMEFRRGKRSRGDVQEFEMHLERNLFALSRDLIQQRYYHGRYHKFTIQDPKVRSISKASVRDRIVHHIVFKELYRLFYNQFSSSVYSGINGRGTHTAVRKIFFSIRAVSKNYTKPCWALKLDIKRFYDSVDHKILKKLIQNKITCNKFLAVIDLIIDSFTVSEKSKIGIPLGNVTSQVFNNIYFSPVDRWISQSWQARNTIRYCDDLIFIGNNKAQLLQLLSRLSQILQNSLLLSIHPQKIQIRNIYKGVDVLGYILLPHTIILRTVTKKRMFRRLQQAGLKSLKSYLGMLSHASSFNLITILKNIEYFSKNPNQLG